jgi:hypothetical protein
VKLGRDFSGHASVNHSKGQYVKLGGFIHVNTAESFHALVKRQMCGAHHAVSEHHLQRNTERANRAIKGAEGKRLMYQQPRSTGMLAKFPSRKR